MKRMLLIIVLLFVAVSAQAKSKNGNPCVVDSQCGGGVCVPNSVGPYGTCAGD